MKAKGLRLISLFILLAMIFTTTGCNNTPDATIPSNGEGLQGERPTKNDIYNIEDYNDFLQTTRDIPGSFITADMLKKLGTFHGFFNDIGTDLSTYSYAFIHEDGNKLFIHINGSSYYRCIVRCFLICIPCRSVLGAFQS